MVKSKRERYEQVRGSIIEKAENGKICNEDKQRILEFLDAKDPECGIVDDPNDTPKADGTLARYAYSIKRVAELGDFDLVGTTARDINYFMDDMRRGHVDGVKDDGLAKGTVCNLQKTTRKFYEYHDDLEVDKEDIILYTTGGSSVDERDIFDQEDIQALRKATEHPRDKALVDFLLYTGQRISATLNLRIKDIDVDQGVFYLNEEAGDLKGASGKRPLLYAEKSAREWLRKHPCKDNPDAHFICQKAENVGQYDYEMGDRLDNSTVYTVLQNVGEKAGVDKPVNAHNFRHTFVTICKRNYGMDNDTIKRLIGHDMDSTVMEETYSHLTDDDVIDAAERATGIKEEEPESPLTPDVCENCGEPIPIDRAKACPSCGIVFTPDAKALEDTLEDKMWSAKGEAATDKENEAVDAIREIYEDNPAAVIQALAEDSDVDIDSLMEES